MQRSKFGNIYEKLTGKSNGRQSSPFGGQGGDNDENKPPTAARGNLIYDDDDEEYDGDLEGSGNGKGNGNGNSVNDQTSTTQPQMRTSKRHSRRNRTSIFSPPKPRTPRRPECERGTPRGHPSGSFQRLGNEGKRIQRSYQKHRSQESKSARRARARAQWQQLDRRDQRDQRPYQRRGSKSHRLDGGGDEMMGMGGEDDDDVARRNEDWRMDLSPEPIGEQYDPWTGGYVREQRYPAVLPNGQPGSYVVRDVYDRNGMEIRRSSVVSEDFVTPQNRGAGGFR